MGDSNIESHRSYTALENRPVFRCRIGAHNLGVQRRGDKSENHLTLYFLIGRGQSVRVDMLPQAGSLQGNLVLRGHNYVLSQGIIKHTDIDAYGCPTNFDPQADFQQGVTGVAVKTFVSFICQRAYHMYRFMYVDGHSLGCRHWIWTVVTELQKASYLKAGNVPSNAQLSLAHLVTHQWDTRYAPRPLTATPGLFLTCNPIEVKNAVIRDHLSRATPDVLSVLGRSLEVRDSDLSTRIQNKIAQGRSLGESTIRSMAAVANSEHREASMAVDLSMVAPQHITYLANALEGRYVLAQAALRSALQMLQLPHGQAQTQSSRIFTLLLAAICDISGPEDEPDDDSEDE